MTKLVEFQDNGEKKGVGGGAKKILNFKQKIVRSLSRFMYVLVCLHPWTKLLRGN